MGANVEEQFKNDCSAETVAIKLYNDSIRLATEVGDNDTEQLFRTILLEEEMHLNWLEQQCKSNKYNFLIIS